MSGPDIPDAVESFQQLFTSYALPSYMVKNVSSVGYCQPTPIQMQAIPLLLQVSRGDRFVVSLSALFHERVNCLCVMLLRRERSWRVLLLDQERRLLLSFRFLLISRYCSNSEQIRPLQWYIAIGSKNNKVSVSALVCVMVECL